MEELKKCSKCGELLPHSAFHKHPGTKSGLQSNCKLCSKKNVAKNYQNNKEYHNKRIKLWRSKNPDKVRLHWIRSNNKACRNLTKSQVANNLGISVKDLSEELYQLKRNSILIYRELKATNTSAAI